MTSTRKVVTHRHRFQKSLSGAHMQGCVRLWREGHGTVAIADALEVYEADVYNRLNRIKKIARDEGTQ